MKQGNVTFISSEIQKSLKKDTTLGSGNFLDKSHVLNPHRDIEFVFLEAPIKLPDGMEYHKLSLQTLMEVRKCLAHWYSSLGVKPGDIMTIIVTNGIAPFLHYLALTSLGATASIINPAMSVSMANLYMQQNGFNRLVVDSGILENNDIANQFDCEVINFSDAKPADLAPLPLIWPYQPEDTTLVMLSHTSGTTGLPKAVRFEHRQFFMGKRARIGEFAESEHERLLTALPQSHSSAISHLETAVMQGIPTFVMSHPTGEPVRKAIKKFAPTMVAGFPQTYTSLVQAGISRNEFSGVKRWFSMGDAAHKSHIDRILVGAPESQFIDAFGSSELGMALFRKISTTGHIAPSRCIGRPVDIAVAKVLDFNTEAEQMPGKVGLLAVRSPTITSGYAQKPEITAKAWRNGYFLTGDVGFYKEGDYYLIDRVVDVIVSSVGPLYSLVLEEEAQQISGVCDVSVVGVKNEIDTQDQVFALVLLDHDKSAEAVVLGEQVFSVLHEAAKVDGVALPQDEVTVAIATGIESFPLGATGKVLKRQLRERYRGLASKLSKKELNTDGLLYVTNGVDRLTHSESIAQT